MSSVVHFIPLLRYDGKSLFISRVPVSKVWNSKFETQILESAKKAPRTHKSACQRHSEWGIGRSCEPCPSAPILQRLTSKNTREVSLTSRPRRSTLPSSDASSS